MPLPLANGTQADVLSITQTTHTHSPSPSAINEHRLPKAEFLLKINTINKEIAVHAARKELAQAMLLFEDAHIKGWANAHTYAGAINCNVRCGQLPAALRLLDRLRKHGKGIKADVIHYTTILKGYCELGDMSAATQVLHDMHLRRVMPNVRTINTYLRGCVQTGATAAADKVIAEMQKEYGSSPDVSSWEYLIALLSQGLKLDKCLPIIGRLKSDDTMSTGMASMHAHVARSAAILGEKKTSRKCISFAKESLTKDELRVNVIGETSAGSAGVGVGDNDADEECGEDGDVDMNGTTTGTAIAGASAGAHIEATGGKRAWREGTVGDSRAQSLALFRAHKISECRSDLDLIEKFLERPQAVDEMLPFFLRVLSLHTATPIDSKPATSSTDARDTIVNQLAEGLLVRFGLTSYLTKHYKMVPSGDFPDTKKEIPISANSATSTGVASGTASDKKDKKSKKKAAAAANAAKAAMSPLQLLPDAHVALVKTHLQRCVKNDGCFDFAQVFATNGSQAKAAGGKGMIRQLKLEICSGAGEWAVAQALADTANDYITLELRHDRVYQTFYRALCAQASNICAIGGDANLVLAQHISPDSLTNVFINHPEPPQQTGALHAGSEGKHLLTLDFFNQVARVLQPGGQVTIVTDNVWYARFLVRLLGTAPHPRALAGVEIDAKTGCKSVEEEGGYKVYLGKPGSFCGHTIDASSYFDRLWKRGNLIDRYVLILKKSSGDSSNLRIRQYKKGAAPADIDATNMPKAKKIKFDDFE